MSDETAATNGRFKKPVKIVIDGREITAEAGHPLLQVALDNGIEIPHYCYHPKLSIDGSCRMCQVRIEKAPKLAIACNTPVTDGGSTGDATPLLRITLSSVLGVGESLTVTRTGPGGSVTVPQTAVGGPAYEYQEASTLASGSYTYSASIADALGNSRTLDINGAGAGTDYTIVVL